MNRYAKTEVVHEVPNCEAPEKERPALPRFGSAETRDCDEHDHGGSFSKTLGLQQPLRQYMKRLRIRHIRSLKRLQVGNVAAKVIDRRGLDKAKGCGKRPREDQTLPMDRES